jgi:dTDP-4-amino-4,6-dideoxyglucose
MMPIVRPRFPPLQSFDLEFDTALTAGVVTNGGPHVRRFEDALSAYLGAPTLAFNNGQTALLALLMAHSIGPNDEVIVPSFTFCGTIHAIAMLGATPVFADIDPMTLTLDLWDVRRRVTKRTKAILGVDVYGICCDYEKITTFAHNAGLLALFDSAPAFGSTVGGAPTGGHGDGQIFSFHATKPFSTMEGGGVCTSNPALASSGGRLSRIRDFGQAPSREVVCTGLNGKMLEVCALIGLENLRTWRRDRTRRRMCGAALRSALAEINRIVLIAEPLGQEPIWTYMPILVVERDKVLASLHNAGIAARTYYQACHRLPRYSNTQALPMTERIADQVIALPLYTDMKDEEIGRVAGAVREAVK